MYILKVYSIYIILYIKIKHVKKNVEMLKMLKKITSDKMNGTKNAVVFYSRAPTHHSFTINLQLVL